MYIAIGEDFAVRDRNIIGIFDLDNTTTSIKTRDFLKRAENEGQVLSVTQDIPKAFVLTQEYGMDRVFLTQFSSQTLEKRMQKSNL